MTETNRITLIDKDNKSTRFELKSKQDAAADIVRHLAKYFTS
jgi:phosphopantothenoylcysteine synthetase/decarboxylase